MANSYIDDLERVQASDVKKRGWRGLLERAQTSVAGAVLVRNHARPEGVLMTVAAYEQLRQAANDSGGAADLQALSEDFARRLDVLRTPQGDASLREALQTALDFDEPVFPQTPQAPR